MALPALVLVLAGPAVPAEAAGPWISPGNGAYLTSDTVTVNAQVTTYGYGGYGNGGGGVLIVDGVRRAFGRDLSYTIDGHQVANGRHYAIATSGYQGPWSVQTTFNMAVPPYAPGGVSVSASGTTVRVSWNKGGEPDLTGYSVNSRYGTLWVPASCPDGRCEASFKVPASADGDLPVSVVANRTGSGPSGPSGGSVRLVAAPKPKPHKTSAKPAPVPKPAPSKSSPVKEKTKTEAAEPPPDTAAIPQPSYDTWMPSSASPAVVTPVASVHHEENVTRNRLMIAWALVIVFVLIIVCVHFANSIRQQRRRRIALAGNSPKSRHRRQTPAPRPQPEIILERRDTTRLALPGGRTGESLSSPGHPVDSDADFPPPWR
jgi:hypothetical protein